MYEAALGLSALCFLAVTIYYVRSPVFSIFHPLTFYVAFHGFLFVLRPIAAWIGNYGDLYRLYEFTPSMSDKITVIVASNVGFLVFAFFCLRVGGMPMRFAEDNAVREERRRLTQAFVWAFAIAAPLAAYSILKSYSASNNTFEGMMIDKSTGISINTVQNGYISDMQLMAVPLGAILIWLARFRIWSFLPAVAFVALRAGTGGRGPFVTSLIAAGLFYLYEKRRRVPALRVTIAAVAMVALFVTVGADRGAGIRQAIGLEQSSGFTAASNDSSILAGMDFANMEFFEYLVYVVPQRSNTYDYFRDNLQVFTEPVPRIFWSGKPIGEPLRRIWLFDYGFPIGMTRSLPGEGWYALGWLGVVIWCGLWGHMLGLLYRKYVTGQQSTFSTACYMVFLPTLVVAFRDGVLLTIVRQTGVYLTPVALWYVIARYIGIPKAAQIRATLGRLAHGRADFDDPNMPPTACRSTTSAPAQSALPAAVQRRRAMLGLQGAGGNTGEA